MPDDVLRWRANLSEGRSATGGHLLLDGESLRFEPHGVERALGRQPYAYVLQHIVGVRISPRGWNPFNGSLRRRLTIDLTAGDSASFVVPRVDDVADALRRRCPNLG